MNTQRFLQAAIQHRYITGVPTFLLGPLTIHGSITNAKFSIPFATTEAILSQSIQRGIHAVNLSEGCITSVLADAMTRCPVFKAKSIQEALVVCQKLQEEMQIMADIIAKTSRYLKLKSLMCWMIGRLIYVRFAFDTGDAMGMNMVTIATERLCEWVTKTMKIRLISLSSNVCSDKKATGVNFLLGRGKTVVAEATITKTVLEKVLHTSASQIVEVVTVKHFVGSALALAPGFANSHIANILAGVFLATGQDLAQVVESSMGIVFAEVEGQGNLYISVTLPCLEVGTVGGGTNLAYAKRSLKIMGCLPNNNIGESAKKYAEIVAGVCLAGELSLIASLAEGTLARGHLKHRKIHE